MSNLPVKNNTFCGISSKDFFYFICFFFGGGEGGRGRYVAGEQIPLSIQQEWILGGIKRCRSAMIGPNCSVDSHQQE